MINRTKKYKEDKTNPYPHVGQLFIKHVKENNINRAALSRKMAVSKGVMNNYHKRKSMQMGIIWNLSIALNHNFVAQIAEQMPVDFETKKETALKNEIAALKDQIEKLEIELEVYKRITNSK